MTRLTLSLGLTLVAATAGHASVVTGPVTYDGHDYYVLSASTWWDAESEAIALGGHLAAINDEAEQDFIYGLIQGQVTAHWIGFTDEAVEGDWIWTTGGPVTYTNWNVPYEPSNSMGIEHCGAAEVAWGGLWNDLPCDRIQPGVVEVIGPGTPIYPVRRGTDAASMNEVAQAAIPWTDPDPVQTPAFPDLLFYEVDGLSRLLMAKETNSVTAYTAWPNVDAPTNSDPWIVAHHRGLGRMEPRVLVLNFSNDTSPATARDLAEQFSNAIAESSRWHGYDDPLAPAFLQYEIVKIVDLRDDPPESTCDGNSTLYPRKPGGVDPNFEYSELYTQTFAANYGYVDPTDPSRYLTLAELVEQGRVHELWFFANHGSCGAPLETIELKQYYDSNFHKASYGPAGNGHDFGMQWIDRSFRITFINAHRGIGCAMENLGHALEGMRGYNAIPYYTGYFREYAGFDLDTRWGLLFSSFYWYDGSDSNSYPTPDTLVANFQGSPQTVNDYYAIGGNVHFTPNGRRHYDLLCPDPVMSTIKSWRTGNGPGDQDLAEPFAIADFGRYYPVAPGCMGPWLVYWRQNMPGLRNAAKEDHGVGIKNWWVFLFY